MLRKCYSLTRHIAIFLVLADLSQAFAAESPDRADIKKQWLTKFFRSRAHTSNIIVLGPRDCGKSTLINMLNHTSEYATREKEGEVLLDSEDPIDPIYNKDLFKFDIHKPVNPKDFAGSHVPEDCSEIPSLESFIPVLGPMAVRDFLRQRAERSSNAEVSAEKTKGGTSHPQAYSSHNKVKKPVFQSTFIDAPGIDPSSPDRLAFFKSVIEKAPSDQIHTFLLVVSADKLVNKDFGPDTFTYYKEIAPILKRFDPTFTRVLLAVTHAGNNDFLSKVTNKQDPRRIAAEKFEKATGMVISTSTYFSSKTSTIA